MTPIFTDPNKFDITIEVVPPSGINPATILDKLAALSHLPVEGFSVATNPVAKSKMSAMVFAHLIQERTKKKAILHLTVRDHNRLGLQSELWGAKALRLDTVICVTGDPSAPDPEHPTTTVNDLNVFELIEMASQAPHHTGAVLDFRPEVNGLSHEIKRMEKKIKAGCRFIVTQPVYDEKTAVEIHRAVAPFHIPVIMGILPLVSYRHAVFLHNKVAGIAVPQGLRDAFEKTDDPIALCKTQARQMIDLARQYFSGACVMPPFDRFEILDGILEK